MAIPAVNLSYIGQPSVAAQGQIFNNGLGGPLSRIAAGIATFVGDGATTSAVVNWIDGVQKPYVTTVVIPVLAVTAPATIGGVTNQAVYSGVGSYGQLRVGQSVTFAGFSNAGNNGAFTINALSSSSIQVTNASSVAETNPAATLTNLQGLGLIAAQASRAVGTTAGVADTAATSIGVTQVDTLTQTGGTVRFSAAPANAATISVLVEVFSAS